MLNDSSSLLAFLKTRRSAKPRDLGPPFPSAEQLAEMATIASRTPDHGKLHPWRFVHVPRERRDEFAALLARAYRHENPSPGRLEIEANERFAQHAAELVVALFAPRASPRIPSWEQELSCGAACMNFVLAAAALGYNAGWVTGWSAYSDEVRRAFGSGEERIAGFIFVGTPPAGLEERVRPELEDIWSQWGG